MAKGRNKPGRHKSTSAPANATGHAARVARKKVRRAETRGNEDSSGGKPVTKTGTRGIPFDQKPAGSYRAHL